MKLIRVALSAPLIVLAGQHADDRAVVLHPLMKEIVAPQAQVLWDVGNLAMDDNGNPDASKLKPADWAKLDGAAQAVKQVGARLAAAPAVVVAEPGTKLENQDAPGAATPQKIQGYIDADRAAFADLARNLAGVADEFVEAAKGRDGVKLAAASGRLDEVCEACHVKFWYPEENGPK